MRKWKRKIKLKVVSYLKMRSIHRGQMAYLPFSFVNLVKQIGWQDDLQLIIQKSGFAKKGKKSKGVAR
ncbi:hypothetical protein [Segetibacter sp.]|jgi:hypothetical protein|uniref:hypothetical protein n=1 Tax=Segetibacter sp. TaxID=2231182 RepID=UPI00261C9FA2|nr:hypothetical protein [Segetibacter sp.]